MPQKEATSSKLETARVHSSKESTWPERYLALQQAYQDVCLERDLLRKALGIYTNHPNTNEGKG